ncbi:MAG: DUF2231 domain-containing protein [Alphaproteobacteria bacterium]|nr:DUF2231 domain-containing protein [Alphaproteobacteria bacterium]
MMNMEIIPNWHPIFVHFTVGLLSLSAALYLAGAALKKPHLLLVARWNLWIGAIITIGTVLAGLDAYNSVTHDALSHAAMTNHKKWALTTASVFMALAAWSFLKHRGAEKTHPVFVGLILVAGGMLMITGFKGGEVVYRHGTGVMRMPMIQGGHGSHNHSGGHSAGMGPAAARHEMPEPEEPGHHDHNQSNH